MGNVSGLGGYDAIGCRRVGGADTFALNRVCCIPLIPLIRLCMGLQDPRNTDTAGILPLFTASLLFSLRNTDCAYVTIFSMAMVPSSPLTNQANIPSETKKGSLDSLEQSVLILQWKDMNPLENDTAGARPLFKAGINLFFPFVSLFGRLITPGLPCFLQLQLPPFP